MKFFRSIVLLSCLFLVVSCNTADMGTAVITPGAPFNPPKGAKMEYNGCAIEAMAFDAALTESKKFDGTKWRHDVLLMTYSEGGQTYGHAMWAYEYEGKIWVGDYGQGSFMVKGKWEDPYSIAVCIFALPLEADWLKGYDHARDASSPLQKK